MDNFVKNIFIVPHWDHIHLYSLTTYKNKCNFSQNTLSLPVKFPCDFKATSVKTPALLQRSITVHTHVFTTPIEMWLQVHVTLKHRPLCHGITNYVVRPIHIHFCVCVWSYERMYISACVQNLYSYLSFVFHYAFPLYKSIRNRCSLMFLTFHSTNITV
jgi:hypothetical protein